jgi:hypothetical protein
MDASTLLYLTKIANSYPGMAAAAAAVAATSGPGTVPINLPQTTSPGMTCFNNEQMHNLLASQTQDPVLFNSMAENYFRRMYSDSVNFSLNQQSLLGSPTSSLSSSNTQGITLPYLNRNDSQSKNVNISSASSPSSSVSSSSNSPNESKIKSSNKSINSGSNSKKYETNSAAANAAAVTMLALKTLSNQFNLPNVLNNPTLSQQNNNNIKNTNTNKFFIADILGLSSNIPRVSATSSGGSSTSSSSSTSSLINNSHSPVISPNSTRSNCISPSSDLKLSNLKKRQLNFVPQSINKSVNNFGKNNFENNSKNLQSSTNYSHLPLHFSQQQGSSKSNFTNSDDTHLRNNFSNQNNLNSISKLIIKNSDTSSLKHKIENFKEENTSDYDGEDDDNLDSDKGIYYIIFHVLS